MWALEAPTLDTLRALGGPGGRGLCPRAISPRMLPRDGLGAQRGSHNLRFGQSLSAQEPTLRNNCYPLKTNRSAKAPTDVSRQHQDSPRFVMCSNIAITHCPHLNLQARSPTRQKMRPAGREEAEEGARGQERGGAPLVLGPSLAPGQPWPTRQGLEGVRWVTPAGGQMVVFGWVLNDIFAE